MKGPMKGPTKEARLIGLSGKLGSGKDTVASIIQMVDFRRQWKTHRFAQVLKQVVAVLTSTSLEDNFSREGKNSVPPGFKHSLGTLQQIVGVSLRQNIGDDVWVNACFSGIRDGEYAIITDVRFANEADAIHERGGIVIRIEGDPTGVRNPNSAIRENRDLSHISETALDDYKNFDAIIYNDGTLEDLRRKVAEVLWNDKL